jgi:putative ABC transport system permease protein
LPAVQAAYLSPATAIRSGARSVTAGRERFGFRRTLVAAQIALSLVLLFGALLFVRTLHNLMTTDAGFKSEGLLTIDIDFRKSPLDYVARDATALELHRSNERRLAVYRELKDRLSSIPGVVSVAQASLLPLSGNTMDNLAGLDAAPAASGKDCHFSDLGPGYFQTMGTPLLAGRDFTERDTPSSLKVAIVNEMFAHTFLGGGNPVGHILHVAADSGKPEPAFQIVGLVKDTKYQELREKFLPIAFFPVTQKESLGSSATFAVRLVGAPGPAINQAKLAVTKLDSSIGIEFRAFSAQLQNSLLRERLMATLSASFGFLAGLVAMLGLYGVIAYMVAHRRNEIGVRLALGASRANVIRLILREAVLLLGFGLAFGTILALWAGKAAASLLFGLQPQDITSLSCAAALLVTVALVASYLPARRAASLDPTVALRSE